MHRRSPLWIFAFAALAGCAQDLAAPMPADGLVITTVAGASCHTGCDPEMGVGTSQMVTLRNTSDHAVFVATCSNYSLALVPQRLPESPWGDVGATVDEQPAHDVIYVPCVPGSRAIAPNDTAQAAVYVHVGVWRMTIKVGMDTTLSPATVSSSAAFEVR